MYWSFYWKYHVSLCQFKELLKESFKYFFYGGIDFLMIFNAFRTFIELCMRDITMSGVEVFFVFLASIGKGYFASFMTKWAFTRFQILKINTTNYDLSIPFYTIFRGIKNILSYFFNKKRRRYG